MGTLSDILSSQVRAEIFRLLLGLDEKELHLREIERPAGLSLSTLSTIRQDLQKLAKLNLVMARRDGNRLYCRADADRPLYPEIRKLVLKTSGLVEIFKSVLDREGFEVAFFFGSIASSSEKAARDVDIMMIGAIYLRTLSKWLSGVSDQIGREIILILLLRIPDAIIIVSTTKKSIRFIQNIFFNKGDGVQKLESQIKKFTPAFWCGGMCGALGKKWSKSIHPVKYGCVNHAGFLGFRTSCVSLKIPRGSPRAGSSPAPGTNDINEL
jgi:DNA-binding transcriptional ArsR family regulator